MIAVDGSRCGIGATSTSPAPNRRRRLPVRALPVRADAPVRVDSALPPPRGPAVVAAPAQSGLAGPPVVAGAANGAMPQVSQ
jgi:hypothetical protein